jgi:hypothetical protein
MKIKATNNAAASSVVNPAISIPLPSRLSCGDPSEQYLTGSCARRQSVLAPLKRNLPYSPENGYDAVLQARGRPDAASSSSARSIIKVQAFINPRTVAGSATAGTRSFAVKHGDRLELGG